jgi:hypothetical protein
MYAIFRQYLIFVSSRLYEASKQNSQKKIKKREGYLEYWIDRTLVFPQVIQRNKYSEIKLRMAWEYKSSGRLTNSVELSTAREATTYAASR